MENNINKYDEENIKILKGLEAVRERPSMHIGNIGIEGLHHLVYEIVDNSIDEAMAGVCTLIQLTINTDIKAVTYNEMFIEKRKNKWVAQVVLDI